MLDSDNVDQIVQGILADMPLKEKAAFANLEEDKVPYTVIRAIFDSCC